jgi:YihY family inner membrane protein
MTDDAAERFGPPDRGTALQRAVTLVRGAVEMALDAELGFLAAAVAHYALLSLVPLATLLLAAATAVDPTAVRRIAAAAVGSAPGSVAGVLTGALTATAGRGGATVLGTLVLLWGGSRVFRGLDAAFVRIYAAPGSGWVRSTVDAVAVLVGVAAALAVGGAVAAGIGSLPAAAGAVALPVGLTVAFLPPYAALPNVAVSVRDALPGAVFAAVAWTVLGVGFGSYAAVAGNYAAYGALGAVLLFVAWLYLAAYCFLLGAVLNATLADRVRVTRRGIDQ